MLHFTVLQTVFVDFDRISYISSGHTKYQSNKIVSKIIIVWRMMVLITPVERIILLSMFSWDYQHNHN